MTNTNKPDAVALLPCPFCGKGAVKWKGSKNGRRLSFAGCLNELCSAERWALPLATWNTRTPPSAPADAPGGGIPTEAMCDNARGFIMGLDLDCREWGVMKKHLEAGGYPSIPRIDTQAEINPKGHITKWDVAECIYVLMNGASARQPVGVQAQEEIASEELAEALWNLEYDGLPLDMVKETGTASGNKRLSGLYRIVKFLQSNFVITKRQPRGER